jgi:hypothetical protein
MVDLELRYFPVMIEQASYVARRATRWWSAPARFTAGAVAALRRSASASAQRHGSWLAHAPVGNRLNAQ